MANNTGRAIFTPQQPAPPPFWHLFTKQNLARVKELQERNETIPDDLSPLVPPNPPENGIYRAFGEQFDVNQTLSGLQDREIQQLFPDSVTGPPLSGDEQGTAGETIASEWTLDRAKYIKKIVRSILLNFLELVDILSEDPMEADFKVQQLRTLFLNAHHLINEYRPHQARETLILMMEEEIAKKRARIQEIKEMKEKMDSMASEMEKMQDIEVQANGTSKSSDINKGESQAWEELTEMNDT